MHDEHPSIWRSVGSDNDAVPSWLCRRGWVRARRASTLAVPATQHRPEWRSSASDASAAAYSGSGPSRSDTVTSVRTTGDPQRAAAVNNAVLSTYVPSGLMKPLTPTVETWTTDRPCSMARIRLIANCCSDSAV